MAALDRRSLLATLGAATMGAGMMSAPAMGGAVPRRLSFDDLKGWAEDDHQAALAAWHKSCPKSSAGQLCDMPSHEARWFFETHFTPVLWEEDPSALFTGYYEPVIRAARQPGNGYRVPLYAPPPDLRARWPHFTRAEIENGALRGRGLELFWLEDPVDAFFLHIQGSGRLILPDGELVRLGFAAKNGHGYVSIGKIFRKQRRSGARAAALKSWLRRNPVEGAVLMQRNPSFIFFQVRSGLSPDDGPVGAMGVPLTSERSLAVDRRFHDLGDPIWVDAKVSSGRIRKLMIGQDTGSAIKGRYRGDIFFGTGDRAGKVAGQTKTRGSMVQLIPNDRLGSGFARKA